MKLSRNKILAILVIVLISTAAFITVSMYAIRTSKGVTQTAISTAIKNGLLYLNSTQQPNGEWSPGNYPVASTAIAILAFENSGHYSWNASDPFNSTIQNGLDWLISQGQNVTLSNQTAGNPDTSGSGIGIEWTGDDYPTYETSMALLAIIGSDAKTNVTQPGPLGVRTYASIARDTVDFLYWAQTDPPSEYAGGWSYQPNNDNSYYGEADQSNTGWPVFALAGAELWGIQPPAWVLQQLNNWIAFDQDMTSNQTTTTLYGSFGYDGPDDILGQVSETAVGIEELTLVGTLSTNASIVAAEGNMNQMWTYNGGSWSWNVNMGNLYAMYNVMRACRDAVPPIQYISYFNGTKGVEWYNGTGQYAEQIIAAQGEDGSWSDGGWASWGAADEFSQPLSTGMAVLILEPFVVNIATTYTLTVTVTDTQTSGAVSGATVLAVGPNTMTATTGANGKATFTNVQAGTYAVTVSANGYLMSDAASVAVTSNTNTAVTIVPTGPASTPKPGAPALHVTVKSNLGYDVTVNPGAPITLTATVSGGTEPYRYQWVIYQAPISPVNKYIDGATSATYQASQTNPGNYQYFIIVFDSAGQLAVSNKVTMTVTSGSSTPTSTPISSTPTPTSVTTATPTPAPIALSLSLVSWVVIIVVVIFLLLLLFLIFWRRKKKKEEDTKQAPPTQPSA